MYVTNIKNTFKFVKVVYGRLLVYFSEHGVYRELASDVLDCDLSLLLQSAAAPAAICGRWS